MILTRSYCEIYTKKILPAVKAYIACLLVKEYKVPQLRVARLLDMAQPAVNYIVTGRRRLRCVDLVERCPELRSLLDYYALEIYNGAVFDPCIICEKITRNNLLLKSILDTLGEGGITGRSCLGGLLGQ